jgi:DNA-binding response OmpR family regulator
MERTLNNYNLQGISVLLVEQHDFMRRIIRQILRELGMRAIRETGDSDTAYQIFLKESVDLVLTDWAPGLDGIYLLDKIRKSTESPNPFVPIVVVTANTEVRHVCHARDHGMTEYLAKPVSAKLIYRRICTVIERHRVFIKNRDFFGPDRRRRALQWSGDERRLYVPAEAPASQAVWS